MAIDPSRPLLVCALVETTPPGLVQGDLAPEVVYCLGCSARVYIAATNRRDADAGLTQPCCWGCASAYIDAEVLKALLADEAGGGEG
jgi:hypothetical protein